MADRNNYYERAFQFFLSELRVTAIPVDESRRACSPDDDTLKSLDFIVNISPHRTLLVDVKGRRLAGKRRSLENWATEDDIQSLGRWEQIFGEGAFALLVFVYHLPSDAYKIHFHDSFSHADRHFGCIALPVSDYRRLMKPRSPRWKTVSIPLAMFREHGRPFSHWL